MRGRFAGRCIANPQIDHPQIDRQGALDLRHNDGTSHLSSSSLGVDCIYTGVDCIYPHVIYMFAGNCIPTQMIIVDARRCFHHRARARRTPGSTVAL